MEVQANFEKEFKDGEIEEGGSAATGGCEQLPTVNEVGGFQTDETLNQNGSATVRNPRTLEVDAVIAEINRKRREELQKRNDEEELQVVSKHISGETFALVKEMMEKSGIFDAASLVKDQLNKSASDEQERLTKPSHQTKKTNLNRGRGELIDDSSVTTVYENAVGDETNETANREKTPVDLNGSGHRNSVKSVKFNSSSEEEALDTSDEMNEEIARQVDHMQISNFVALDPSGGRADGQMPSTPTGGGFTMRRSLETHDLNQ